MIRERMVAVVDATPFTLLCHLPSSQLLVHHPVACWQAGAGARQRLTLVCSASQPPDGNDGKKGASALAGLGFPSHQLQPLRLSKGALPLRLLLAVSAGAALLLLRRKQGKGVMSSSQLPQLQNAKKIDSHLHVWASPAEAKRFAYFPGQEPSLPGNVDLLLAEMEEAGVAGALVVQPINHKFDHSYLAFVLKLYPDKFVGCCLADPTTGMAGVAELERLVDLGFRAVRFNPYLWPQGHKMTDAVGKALFAKAGELGIPVGFMCFKGLLLHVDEIEELCRQFPNTLVFLDHFGFCKPATDEAEEEAWRRLLALSRFPQIYIKASAFFRVSREMFPYKDTWPLLRQLVDTFGASKLMWGTDFPYVQSECGYGKAWEILSEEDGLFTKEELQWIFGGTIQSLFELEWGGKFRVPFGGEWAERFLSA